MTGVCVCVVEQQRNKLNEMGISHLLMAKAGLEGDLFFMQEAADGLRYLNSFLLSSFFIQSSWECVMESPPKGKVRTS